MRKEEEGGDPRLRGEGRKVFPLSAVLTSHTHCEREREREREREEEETAEGRESSMRKDEIPPEFVRRHTTVLFSLRRKECPFSVGGGK